DPDPITLVSKLDISDPLHLHPNDTTASIVVSIKLKGDENYQVWSCAMLLALEGKNKTCFIDETCKRSNTDEKQYDAMIELHKCIRNASESFKKNNMLLKLMQLFMGLDDFYMQIRSSILSREVLPDVRNAYAIISSEESHRVAAGSIVVLNTVNVSLGNHTGMKVADPTKVKVGERERAIGEARLLDSTVGRVVLLLPVAPARAESDLEGSVEKLFNEGGNADQVDSAISGGQEAEVGIATGVRIVAEENMATERPRHPQKKRQVIADTGAVPTLPMVTSSVSATPENESGAPSDSITGPNVCTIDASERFIISLDSSHHSSTHASEAEGDSFIRSGIIPPVMTKVVVTSHVVDIPLVLEMDVKVTSPMRASLFQVSDSTEIVKADIAGPSYSAKQDLSMGSRELNSETLRQVFVLQWNFLNDSLLDHYDVSREFVNHLAPLALFSCIREMDYHHLFTEFIVGTAHQAFLNAEVKMRIEYCLSERKRLESKCEKKADLLKVRDAKIESLKARLLLKETEAAEVIHLCDRVSTSEVMKKKHVSEIDALKQKNVAFKNKKGSLDGKVVELQSLVSTKDLKLKELNMHELEVTCCCERLSGYENLTDWLEEFQDAQLKVVNDKVAKLNADLAKMACHLEEKFYPHLLTTISGQRWLLTHRLKLVLVKCLNSSKYLTTFGAAISRSIKKRMQDGLAARIDHGREGTSLTDVAAYNPSAESDFNSALQELCKLDYPLLSKLKSHKDASVEDIMNLLRLKGPHVDASGIGALHPDIEKLKVPIRRSEDQIKENIVAERSALLNVWTPLSESLSVQNLIGDASTSASVPATTTMTLSTTFASASSIPPNIVDDYEIVHADGQESPQGNVQRDVATVEFENEDLDTTTECNLLS
nr:ribonuclease H-like domain-containing protein [Tanacetum cinerariifolium]